MEVAGVVCDEGASSGSTNGDDTRSADVAGIARGTAKRTIQAEPTRTAKERLGRKVSDGQRVDNCKVPPALRGSEAAAGRMRRRRTHEELQMSMGRERAHLAQVANHDHPIVRRDVVGLIVR